MSNNNLKYTISLDMRDGGMTGQIEAIGQHLSMADGQAQKLGKAFSSVGETGIRVIKSLGFNQLIEGIRNVSDGLSELNAPRLTFGQSMADLSSITGITGKDLDTLRQSARSLGIEAGIGATAAADSYAVLASQIQVDKIGMNGLITLQKETITLSQAAGMSMTDAAMALSGTINQFGLAATESSRVINVLAAGSKYGAASITELSESFKVTGAVAAGAGISLEETAGAIEVLSKNNLKGAEAGTGLRNVLTALQTKLGINVGENGLAASLSQLKGQLDAMASPVERATFLAETFGRENLTAAQFLIENAAAVSEMTQKVTDTNVATEQAEIRTNTWAHHMEVAKAKIDNLKISITDATGNILPMAEMLSSQAVTMAGLIPLFSALKSGIMAIIPTITQMVAGQWSLNAAMTANPIGVVVAAIAALSTGMVLAYKHSDSFRRVIDDGWATLKRLGSMIWDNIKPILIRLGELLQRLWPIIKKVGEVVIDFILTPVKAVIWAINKVLDIIGVSASATENAADAQKKYGKAIDNAAASLKEQAAAQTDLKANMAKTAVAANDAGGQIEDLATTTNKATRTINHDLSTIGGVQTRLQALQQELNQAHDAERAKIMQEIILLQKKEQQMRLIATAQARAAIEGPLKHVNAKKPITPDAPQSVVGTDNWMKGVTDGINRYIDRSRDRLAELNRLRFDNLKSNLNGISDIMGNLSGIVGDGAGAWLQWGAQVLKAVSSALPALVALFTSQTGVAATGAAASVAGIPFVGPVMAIAAVSSVLAALSSVPKPRAFAEGGLIYGPTVALMGEYAGAAGNPEVVAPLDRLRDIVGGGDDADGTVDFRIRADRLEGILKKKRKRNSRTR